MHWACMLLSSVMLWVVNFFSQLYRELKFWRLSGKESTKWLGWWAVESCQKVNKQAFMIKGWSRAHMRLKKAFIIGFRELNVHDMLLNKGEKVHWVGNDIMTRGKHYLSHQSLVNLNTKSHKVCVFKIVCGWLDQKIHIWSLYAYARSTGCWK